MTSTNVIERQRADTYTTRAFLQRESHPGGRVCVGVANKTTRGIPSSYRYLVSRW